HFEKRFAGGQGAAAIIERCGCGWRSGGAHLRYSSLAVTRISLSPPSTALGTTWRRFRKTGAVIGEDLKLSMRWQAAQWPGFTSRRAGSSCAQRRRILAVSPALLISMVSAGPSLWAAWRV